METNKIRDSSNNKIGYNLKTNTTPKLNRK